MPLQRCGTNGWKWGDSGHCYAGPSGKKQAIKQGVAIEGPDKFKSMAKSDRDPVTEYELELAHAEWRAEGSKVYKEPIKKDKDGKVIDSGNDNSSFAYVSQEERNKMASDDFGWPEEKKYPITNQDHLDSAVKLIGRAPKDEQGRIKANIRRIAARRGLHLPDSWVNE